MSRSVLRLLSDDEAELVVVPGAHAQWPDPGHRAGVTGRPTLCTRGVNAATDWRNAWRAAGARAWLGVHDVLEQPVALTNRWWRPTSWQHCRAGALLCSAPASPSVTCILSLRPAPT
jgi:hypothetical protein